MTRAECRAYCQSVVTAKRAESICLLRDSCFPADSYCMARLLSAIVLACRSGFKRRVEFLELNGSWTSFVDDVERCFRSSPETAEAGCGGHLANPLFAGLRAQAQRDFLRTRTWRAQQS